MIRLTSTSDHAACRASFATRGMGSGAHGPAHDFDIDSDPGTIEVYDPADIQESFVDAN